MNVVTRFPPSPTGFMHIGNARTALFNWLYARANGGKFVVRIEDTDRKRHSEEAVEAIIRGLEWLGLNWDGEIVSQFARADRHREVAQQLLDEGKAYYCYCSPEELEVMREDAKTTGRPTAYDKRWRDKSPSEAPADIKPVVRIKAPLSGKTIIKDEVQGEVSVNNEQIDDFIILRSDGTPTYMLSVVVDDHDMGVTHIIRGDDHLNNAFRQQVIIDAMGWDIPVYAHTPLIHGPDGKKFSKRHGAQSVEEYKEMGYLADAMFNYLLRLGWAHGDDEIISRKQAVKWFSLSSLGKSPANFDFAKLENLNANYIKESDINSLIELTKPIFEQKGLTISDKKIAYITAGQDELKNRSKTLLQFVDEAAFYCKALPLEYEDKAAQTIKDNGDTLRAMISALESAEPLTKENAMPFFKQFAQDHADGKLGKVGMPLRAALTGKTSSVSIFEAAGILGTEDVISRINSALSQNT
ncbi:MAG: glutamate--tRNA ligase [Alphaproteobacteria bacterium]|nr:glutamate--tRNA ligase [Alphaproteobacteria bacterium]|tara:strand:+ start:31930 stop:33336 length:1407 start_codon:yes stop_codon:yes gene_type:complete